MNPFIMIATALVVLTALPWPVLATVGFLALCYGVIAWVNA